jgi:tetratricopeptide (TPR) repeat protein
MMKPKYTVLSVAIVAILAGCGETMPEKKVEVAPSESSGSAVTKVKPATAEPAAAAVEVKPVAPQAEMAPPAEPVAEPAAPAAEMKPAPKPEVAPVAKLAPMPAVEQPKPTLKIPTDPNTFLITAETKTREHPFYGMGKSMGFAVNGKQGHEVVVIRGQTYKFIVHTGVQHDFYLTTSAAGWGSGTYTDGVAGQFIYEGEVTFKPGKNTPDLLYYGCRNHKFMGGKIYVLDKKEDLAKVKAATAGSEKSSMRSRRSAAIVSESSVKQKLSYAKMVLGSGSAKRIEASGNTAAIKMLNDARSQITAAGTSFAGGKLEQSMGQIDEGLRLLTAASRQITTESEMSGVNYKATYDELSNSLQTYEKSYKRHVDHANKTKQPLKTTLDEAEYNRLVSAGKASADKEDYASASKSLEKAQAMIVGVLTDMLHSQTVTYDKNFETPKEEYEFELARLESYEELIPLAIEQKQPSERALELIDGFVKKAAKIKSEGKDVAAKGDYKMAIMAMQAATSNLQRALRLAGVN